MAVLDFVNDISNASERGKNTIGIFMDLSKAFDTIDHNILMNKLYHYGFRGVAFDWFRNYLSDRTQYVVYNSSSSTKISMSCGVPQGSILGPLLFILYMNDICNTSKVLNTILFADDTTIFYSHENLSVLCDTVNNELDEVSNWFKANKLSLNAKKTNLMFLGTRHQTSTINSNCTIRLDGCILDRVHEAKFLGITIDENLTWKKHIENVSRTCSRNIGVLYKVNKFLPQSALYQLYCSLVQPYLNYGLLLWGNANKEYINKLFRIQKRALRAISNSSYLSPTKPLFEKFNLMNIFDLYIKDSAIFMYKYKHKMLPPSFDNFFIIHSNYHTYDTRNKNDFRLPLTRTKSFTSVGPKIWNDLPRNVKDAKSLSLFKKKIRVLINSY